MAGLQVKTLDQWESFPPINQQSLWETKENQQGNQWEILGSMG
jgi:hypothetical protein